MTNLFSTAGGFVDPTGRRVRLVGVYTNRPGTVIEHSRNRSTAFAFCVPHVVVVSYFFALLSPVRVRAFIFLLGTVSPRHTNT